MTQLTDGDQTRLREMIEEVWVEAAITKNWAAAMAVCSEDLAYMPQDHPTLHGRDEATSYLEGFPAILRMTQSVESVTGDRGLAVFRGTFEASIENEGEEVDGTGKFLGTASKDSGEWLFTAVCFNWDAPLA